jgi:hypothetical protein
MVKGRTRGNKGKNWRRERRRYKEGKRVTGRERTKERKEKRLGKED